MKKLFLIGTLVFVSCGPTITLQRLNTQQYLEKPPDAPIAVFFTKAPKCPYDEIGVTKATEGAFAGDETTFIEAMKKKAREVGGDALLLNQVNSNNAGYVALAPGVVSSVNESTQSATIIRFKNSDCRE
jgi:hypothetical protein